MNPGSQLNLALILAKQGVNLKGLNGRWSNKSDSLDTPDAIGVFEKTGHGMGMVRGVKMWN